jgi:light-regulated signal transduction histidine kinase (bacteriophytochrome)
MTAFTLSYRRGSFAQSAMFNTRANALTGAYALINQEGHHTFSIEDKGIVVMCHFQIQEHSVLLGGVLSAKIAQLSQSRRSGDFIGQLQTCLGETLDISAHISDTKIIVELEAASPAGVPGSILLDELASAAAGFERSASLNTLCDQAAIAFRRLTNFDRVMIYRFLDDGVGCVVAEDRREGMHSFLNHHFPASDIPKQASDLCRMR